jgi:hypothetical protein
MWTFADISKESGKVVPSLADFDSSSTPVFVSRSVGVKTSIAHATPNAVKRMSSSVSGESVSTSQATAGTDSIFSEFRYTGNDKDTTITTAAPQCAAARIFTGWSNRNQSAETHTLGVDEVAHWTAHIGSREVAGSVLMHRSCCAL